MFLKILIILLCVSCVVFKMNSAATTKNTWFHGETTVHSWDDCRGQSWSVHYWAAGLWLKAVLSKLWNVKNVTSTLKMDAFFFLFIDHIIDHSSPQMVEERKHHYLIFIQQWYIHQGHILNLWTTATTTGVYSKLQWSNNVFSSCK